MNRFNPRSCAGRMRLLAYKVRAPGLFSITMQKPMALTTYGLAGINVPGSGRIETRLTSGSWLNQEFCGREYVN